MKFLYYEQDFWSQGDSQYAILIVYCISVILEQA